MVGRETAPEGQGCVNRRVRALAVALAVMLAAASGCGGQGTPRSQTTVRIGALTYRVEVARTAEEQKEGLAGRKDLPDGTGMLFRFGRSGEQQVWMAGMTVPLDIAWISGNEVLAVDTLFPCDDPDQSRCPRWTSPGSVDALLEVPAYSLDDVAAGMRVTVTE